MELGYAARQIQRVLDAEPEQEQEQFFLMRISSGTTATSTKWLSLTRDDVRAIRNILQVKEIQ